MLLVHPVPLLVESNLSVRVDNRRPAGLVVVCGVLILVAPKQRSPHNFLS